MSKKIKIFNIVMFVLTFIAGTTYLIVDRQNLMEYPVILKSVASVMFVVMGLTNLIYVLQHKTNNKKFPIWLFSGLVLACFGDIFLEFNFVVGAALFALGHVLFFISYCFIEKFNWKDLLFGAIVFVFALLIILLVPIFNFGGLYKAVCVVYALIISLMLGKAISNVVKSKSLLNIIILVGCALFFFSDAMLLFSLFGGVKICSYFCILTYYPAEIVLAYSIAKSKEIKN